ncbi:MAG: AAA family ATPase [Patescibacteria group bacterium]
MLIKKVILDNIRSYLHEEIDFPEGSILLSGNIGSGKSTVLMAVEFALFGLRRGEMSGASLLRNGAEKGSVLLEMQIEGKDAAIGRTLKRTSSGVSQDSGFIEIDNEKKQMTAVELKQKVLELLNYPKAALTKNDLLFRYTVYVSQEDMKQILLGDKESRLNALRYVFGIDKFKRIRENAGIISSRAGEKKREAAGAIADLEQKKEEESKARGELRLLNEGILLFKPFVGKAKADVETKKKSAEEIEAEIKKADAARHKSEWLAHRQKLAESQNKIDNAELKEIEERLKQNFEKPSGKDFPAEMNSKRNELKGIEARMGKIVESIYSLKAGKKHSEELKKKILEIDSCPTCMQKVENEHKERISNEESQKIEKIENELGMHLRTEEELKKAAERINSNIEKIREDEKKEILLKEKLKALEEALRKKENIMLRIKSNEETLKQLNKEALELKQELKMLPEIELKQKNARQELEKAIEELKKAEVKMAEMQAKSSTLARMAEGLSLDIKKKEEKKKEMERMAVVRQWIDDYFISLMAEMEKSVMAKAHAGFNELLEKWFAMLVDNEAITIRLDPEFTPIVEQNGYEIDYGFLSGGEKTAAALAYRLALNQVINKLMSDIKTKDIIILDEPTDGFSEEQLEKMKLVLKELDTSQAILVSHEQKIESFVQSIVRFEKRGHESNVAGG